jgi:hypothetical protein
MARQGMPGAARRVGAGLAGVTVVASAIAAAGGTVLAADPPAPSSPSASQGPGSARHIDLVETSMMQILDGAGQPVPVLVVRPGETVEIGITNGARFPHNLVIGPHDALAAGEIADLPGVPAFTGSTRSFTWTVPASVDDLWFGCTVVGHFAVMQGRVVALAEVMPDLAGLPEADAIALLQASGLLAVERSESPDPAAEPGTVLAQQPAAGAPVDLDTVVQVTVAAAA